MIIATWAQSKPNGDKRMIIYKLKSAVLPLMVALMCNSGVNAGTYKHITVDGNFSDWAGIPVAYTQAPDTTQSIAYTNIYVANDENYLYIRFAISTSDDPFTSRQNIFIDVDNNTLTGYSAGGYVGSEMLVQGGAGYQEKSGNFNAGGINGLDWLAAPAGPATEFELRIALNATNASDATPVFAGDTIALVLESETVSFTPTEWVPPVAGGLVYTFASPPSVLTTNLPLITLTNTTWRANAAGNDLGSGWLDQGYDDTQPEWLSGTGLLGYTPNPGAYPAINTPLASGANTYYFRAHFNWNNLPDNVAFVVTNYLSDGAVYYLNGVEANRVRMPAGAVAYSTSATGTNAPVGQPSVFGISSAPLVLGDNILEVESHQATASSADMVFGLSLMAAAQYSIINLDSTQPADRTVNGGDPSTFSADMLGSGPLSYQWLLGGNPIPGATNASYTIAQVIYTHAGSYSLRVSNLLSTNTTRAAVLTVTNTPVTFADASQPADVVVVEGRYAMLSSVVAGSPPFHYQWYFGANPISAATNDSFTIPAAMPADAGSYSVTVSNQVISTNSRTATLTVLLDTLPPVITNISASATQIVVSFSEPLDALTAANPAKYSVSGGLNVVGAALNPGDGTQVTLTTGSGMSLGVVYTLSVNGVKDLFGNAAVTAGSFTRGIAIDGDFGDWDGIAPIYSGPIGNPDAADFKDIYVFNDAKQYYFRVTLWHDVPPDAGRFPDYANLFYDTDNNVNSGFLPGTIGSELLTQSGFGYQEKNGGFNEGGIDNLDWFCLPTTPGTNFEFSISRAALYASDNLPVFTTNLLNFHFEGQTSSFAAANEAPATGVLSYTNVNTTVPSLPVSRLAISPLPGSRVAVVWELPGTLQARGSLTGGSWTNAPGASSPYIAPVLGSQLYFRLAQ